MDDIRNLIHYTIHVLQIPVFELSCNQLFLHRSLNRHQIFHSSMIELLPKSINQEQITLPKNSLMSHVSKKHQPKWCPGCHGHGRDLDRAQALADTCILWCSGCGMWSVLSSRARIYLSLLRQGLRGLMLRGVLCWYQMSSYNTCGPLSLFCSTKKHTYFCKGVLTCWNTAWNHWEGRLVQFREVNQAPRQLWAETAISTPFVHPCIVWVLSSLAQLRYIWAWSPARAAVTCKAHTMETSRKASMFLMSQMSQANIKCLCSPRPHQFYKLMWSSP